MGQAAIVILNYNGRKMLEKFLPSLIKFSEFPVFVADNQSTDDSLDFLANHYPQVRVIHLEENFGFALGYNKALEKIKGQFSHYFLLNSDVEVSPDWDRKLMEWMLAHPEAVAVQPKILSFQNRRYFDHAGAGGGFLDALGFPYCRGRMLEVIEEDFAQYDDTIPVDWASGACMLVRADRFHDFHGFDDRFFAHMEEIDLCWRWRIAGHTPYYHGKVSVYHVGGATLSRSNPKKTYLNFRNSLLMLHKNLPSSRMWWIYLLRLLMDAGAFAFFCFQGKTKDAQAVVRAHRDYLQMKSQDVPQKSAEKCRNYSSVFSVVWAYYMKGKRYYSKL